MEMNSGYVKLSCSTNSFLLKEMMVQLKLTCSCGVDYPGIICTSNAGYVTLSFCVIVEFSIRSYNSSAISMSSSNRSVTRPFDCTFLIRTPSSSVPPLLTPCTLFNHSEYFHYKEQFGSQVEPVSACTVTATTLVTFAVAADSLLFSNSLLFSISLSPPVSNKMVSG